MDKPFRRLIKIIILIFLVIITYHILSFTFIYLYPFIIATIFSFILHPIVSVVEHRLNINRLIATCLVMVGFASIIGISMFSFSKWLLLESKMLMKHIPYYIRFINEQTQFLFQSFFVPTYEKFQTTLPILPPLITEQLNDILHLLFNHISLTSTQFFEHIIYGLSSLFSSITYLGTICIIILIATFIITNDMTHFIHHIHEFVPKKVKKKSSHMIKTLKSTSFNFLKAQLILASCSTCIILIFFLIWKIEHAFIISLIIFFIDLLPYFGIGLLFIPWIIFLFVTGNYLLTLKLATLYVIVIIIRQLIEPKIIASSMGLHPLFSLIILFLTFKLWGIFGIILTPFILIGMSTLYQSRIIHHMWQFINE